MATATQKPHVSDQSCGNCAYSRPVDPTGNYGIECRWDCPPWQSVHPRHGWCRRWAAIPAPKKPVVKDLNDV